MPLHRSTYAWIASLGLSVAVPAQTIVLTQLSTPFNAPIGIDYHEPTNTLIVSANYSSGLPHNLERVEFDGSRTVYSSLAGLTEELKIATVRSIGNPGGFVVGDVFTGNGIDGQIVRVTDGGATVFNPWVVLPGGGHGLIRGSLYVDRTGLYGGDLIVCTTGGEVWRVDNAGTPSFIVDVNTHLEGLCTVPNDPGRWGPIAGRIIAGAEDQGLMYSFDAAGNFDTYALGVAIEDIDVIQPNESFFGVNFGTGELLAAAASQFAAFAGDILLTQESGGGSRLFRLFWDGSSLQATQFAIGAGSEPIGQWEHVCFAPVGVAPFPSCETSAGSSVMGSVGVPLSFTVTGLDPDPTDIVTVTATGVPAGATLTPALPVSGNPVVTTFEWTPGNAAVGTTTVVFTVTDSTGLETSCAVTITVAECYLMAGFSPANVPLFGDPADVLLVQPLVAWPVTLTQIPVVGVPANAALSGIHVYLQVVMFNPFVFPNDPLMLTDGLDVAINGGLPQKYGPVSGMEIWGNSQATLGGVIDVGFSIPPF